MPHHNDDSEPASMKCLQARRKPREGGDRDRLLESPVDDEMSRHFGLLNDAASKFQRAIRGTLVRPKCSSKPGILTVVVGNY